MVFDLFRKNIDKSEMFLQYPAKARLYEFEDRLFVCSVWGISETDSLTDLEGTVENADLGNAVLRHLADFRSEDPRNHRNARLTDWTAFKTSGASSIKAFERRLWHVDLAIMNSAVLVWAAPRLSLNECELSAYATASRNMPEKVGAAIRKTLAAAKLLRKEGVV